MASAECAAAVDHNGRELLEYGAPLFNMGSNAA